MLLFFIPLPRSHSLFYHLFPFWVIASCFLASEREEEGTTEGDCAEVVSQRWYHLKHRQGTITQVVFYKDRISTIVFCVIFHFIFLLHPAAFFNTNSETGTGNPRWCITNSLYGEYELLPSGWRYRVTPWDLCHSFTQILEIWGVIWPQDPHLGYENLPIFEVLRSASVPSCVNKHWTLKIQKGRFSVLDCHVDVWKKPLGV